MGLGHCRGGRQKVLRGRTKTLPCICSVNAGAGGGAAGGDAGSRDVAGPHPAAVPEVTPRDVGRLLRARAEAPSPRSSAAQLAKSNLRRRLCLQVCVSWLEDSRVGRRVEEISVLQHCPPPVLKQAGLTPLSKFMTLYFSFFGGSEPSHGSWVALQRFC